VYKSFGTWSWPTDVDAFERHYWNVHVPKAKAVPGLQSLSTLRADDSGRESGIYRYAELAFIDKKAYELAAASAEWWAMEQDAAELIERFGVQVIGATGWQDEPR
jgi:uncharacterized protein (TIGR02118 family)